MTRLPDRVPFLEVHLNALTTRDFLEIVPQTAEQLREERGHGGNWRPLRISYINAHCSNLTARDREYRHIMDHLDLVYADGQAVVWASRRLGHPVPERVNAGDFIREFLETCAEKHLRVALLGGAAGVAERAARNWHQMIPGLRIVGAWHGYFAPQEEETLVAEIRAVRPDVLLIGMGAPRQETWMTRWGRNTNAVVLWSVGALFEYCAGVTPRAPRWMRRVGLEWLFRLVVEPRRLWKRYLVGNLVFIWRVMTRANKKHDDKPHLGQME